MKEKYVFPTSAILFVAVPLWEKLLVLYQLCVHQQVSNCICGLLGAEQVVHIRFTKDFC